MPATREDLVKIARAAVGGLNRPSVECEATFTQPWGETVTMQVACDHSVRNPASYDPPEWVLEALQRAYERGRADSRKAETAIPSRQPIGEMLGDILPDVPLDDDRREPPL